MEIPALLHIVGWGGFATVLFASGVLSLLYVRYYRNKRSSLCSSTTTGVISLMVTLAALALTPVDVFIVTYMKDTDGEFKSWAQDNATRERVEDAILYTYYSDGYPIVGGRILLSGGQRPSKVNRGETLYSLVIAFLFLIIPFVIFFYEEDDEDSTFASRLCEAVKYTSCFLGFAVILLLVGAFIPTSSQSPANHTAWQEIQYLLKEIGESRGENALYFLISFVMLVGLFAIVVYTTYGMITVPLDLIRGKRDTEEELRTIRLRRERNEEQRRRLERRYGERRTTANSYRDRQDQLEDEQMLIQRSEDQLVAISDNRRGFRHKCSLLWWPFRITVGICLLLVDLMIVLSLFLTSLDRALHSLGPKSGYILQKRTLPNPVDYLLMLCQELFPLDFILFVLLLLFFMWASMAGIRKIGIWFCCLRMYKIRPHQTKAQGVLFMCMVMMYILMALNLMMFSIAPDYLSFGNQKYVRNDTGEVAQCTLEAGDECVLTVTTALLAQFAFNFWFFGACYYWVTWLFLGFVLISVVVAVLKKPTSSIDGMVDSSDLDDSDDEPLQV